ncbi:MAG: hypothetical protein ACT4PU_06605 [Planctomycetota bacterium]
MKLSLSKSLIAGLLGLILLPGCVNNRAGDYVYNRGADFVDMLRLNVKFGKGVGVKYEWANMLQLGLLWEDETWAAGLGNRELAYWRQSIFSWGVIVGEHQETIHGGLTDNRYSGSYGWRFGDDSDTNGIYAGDPDNLLSVLTLRGNVMFGVGVDVELRYGEALDFLAGLAQFDPAGDDIAYTSLRTAD